MATDSEKSLFNPGLKGTLSPAEYTNKPMPHWGPTYPSPDTPYYYRDIDMIVVSYACDAAKAAALLPEELELVDIPALPGQAAVNHVFAKYRENDQIGPYTEFIVNIPVLHKGALYLYVPAIYVDNEAALTAGREFGGYPKKMAQITMRNYGNLFLSQMSRGSMQEKTSDPNFSDVASSRVTKGGKLASVPLPADKTPQMPFPYNLLLPLPPATGKPQNLVLPTMGLLRIPGVGPGPDGAVGARTILLVGSPWVVTKADIFIGVDPSIELYHSKEDPIGELLPIDAVIGSYIIRGDLYTDPMNWHVVADLKNKKP
jgi:Acetoacetate decarboxylase (ADC)